MSRDRSLDILMITYNRAHYTRLALTRLLDTCDETMRVWLWHNGDHAETLAVTRELSAHPRVHRFHHSAENKRLREPTNWLFAESAGAYVSKVDDDCLLPDGWADTLRDAHEADERLGVVGCWRFLPEDFDPALAEHKIAEFAGGHRVLRNLWVEGSGYVAKRACVDACSLIRPKESFSGWCIRAARKGFVNGWYYPFIWQEHMDDPRVPHTALKSDADLAGNLPLSAVNRGVRTLAQWEAQLRQSARTVQAASLNPVLYTPAGRFVRRALRRLGLSAEGRAS